MRVSGKQGVVGMPIPRIRECAADLSGDAEVLAPGVCRLQVDPARRPQRERRGQRVVVVGVDAGEHVRLPELRIRPDEVLRESVVPEDGAIHKCRNRRQTPVTRGAGHIVQ